MMELDQNLLLALAAVLLHVLNYNGTARIEHKSRFFTKILGRNAVYYYAVFLLASAGLRDRVVEWALVADAGSFSLPFHVEIGTVMFVSGFLLNLWTLHALGIKGMYNGDSFGWLMDSPVTTGPYVYFNDPQYVGTTWAMLGAAVYYASLHGLALTAWMGIVFYGSVQFLEGPHLRNLYDPRNRRANKLY